MKVSDYQKETKRAMRALKTYKKEFDPIITIYCGMREQYDELTTQFLADPAAYEKNGKKSPLVSALETLRKDILTYARDLGLTPQGLLKFNESLEIEKKPDEKLGGLVNILNGADVN